MYKIVFESENQNISDTFELENLDDFYESCSLYENVGRYSLADVLDNVDYGINILEPVPEKNDFIFKYSSSTLWDNFHPNLHEYMNGRLFGDLFPKFEEFGALNTINKIFYENFRLDAVLKLYKDNKLLKVWSEINLKQNNLLLFCFQDKTDFYLEKEKEDTIFEFSSFPMLELNRDEKIVKVNSAFIGSLGYNLEDLSKMGLDGFLKSFNSVHTKIKNFHQGLELLFNKEVSYDNAEVKFIDKYGAEKWFKSHVRLVTDDLIQVSLYDLSDLKELEKNSLNLNEYLADIEEASKTFFSIYDSEGFHWTNEIFNILEINPEDKRSLTKENIIYHYAPQKSIQKIKESLKSLTLDNPVTVEYKIITAKGNTKYLRVFYKLKMLDCEIIRLGFTQDITEEVLAQKSAMKLHDNIELLESYSKIVFAEYCNGNILFTNEIYDILETTPEENSPDDFINFIVPEDREVFANHMNNVSKDNPGFKTIFRLKTAKGDSRYISSNGMGKFNEKGELIKIVGFLQDVTEETLAKKSAMELQKSLSIIQSSSKIVIASFKDKIFSWTDEIYKILEINPEDYPKGVDLIDIFTIPEEKGKVYKQMDDLSPENPRFRNQTTIKTVNNNFKVLEAFVEGEFDNEGDLVATIAFIHEITDRIKRENELEQLSEDRMILLQEVHHRVKNNLQLITSFLSLDSRYNKDNPEYVIEKTKNRLDAMALTHEELYQSPNVSNMDLKPLLENELNNLFIKYGVNNIKRNFNLDSAFVDVDKAMPLALLVNELAYNTILHAFPNTDNGNFFLDMNVTGDVIDVKIRDDGVGLPSDVDFLSSSSLGFIIIRRLADQLEAELSMLTDVPGFGVELIFRK